MNITISFMGEASIKDNKVVVDYTELKNIMASRSRLLKIAKAVSDGKFNQAGIIGQARAAVKATKE